MATAKMFTARIRWRIVNRLVQVRKRPTLRPSRSRPSRSRRSLFGKAIADAVERLDRIEAVVRGAELAAHTFDVAVDRPVVDIDVVLVGDVHQLVARFHHTRALRE